MIVSGGAHVINPDTDMFYDRVNGSYFHQKLANRIAMSESPFNKPFALVWKDIVD